MRIAGALFCEASSSSHESRPELSPENEPCKVESGGLKACRLKTAARLAVELSLTDLKLKPRLRRRSLALPSPWPHANGDVLNWVVGCKG